MIVLPSTLRTCARKTLPSTSRPAILPHHYPLQSRNLTTNTQDQAQPIDLTSSTPSTSPSEPSTNTSIPPTSKPPCTASTSSSHPPTQFATVTRANTMRDTVQLTTHVTVLNRRLQKYYTRPRRMLAHDPNPAGFLREGDVVQYSAWNAEELALRETKRKGIKTKLVKEGAISFITKAGKVRPLKEVGLRFAGPEVVVRKVVTPFGVAVEERVKA